MHKINMDKVKRERGVNFSLEERDILVSLVLKYKDYLENKQSDASTWKIKECTWVKIEKEFNARSGAAQRNSKALRIKYEGLKRSVRKKSAAIRSELYRTGGGSNTASPLDSTEEKIKSLITLSTYGLESVFDSDVLPQTQHSQGNFQKKSLDELTQAKLELVQLQKELLRTEMVEKRKESKFKEKQRQWMEEEHLLNLKILQNKLNK